MSYTQSNVTTALESASVKYSGRDSTSEASFGGDRIEDAVIPVLDLTDITMGNPVPSKWVHGESAKSAFKTVSKQEEQTKVVVEGRRLFLETEGDLYHGYNSSVLLLPFVERACALCNGRG